MDIGKENKTQATRRSRSTFKLTLGAVLLIGLVLSAPVRAEFDHIFFSVNGDTTATSMIQGDVFYWASNCDTGASVNWQVWYDVNGNGTIESSTDVILASENITDGDPLTEPDPIKDGLSIGEMLLLTAEPGTYIFQATDLATDSSLKKTMAMYAMPSPPNQFTGQIALPGVTPPDSRLANKIVFAESDSGDEGIFLSMTDNMGIYSMNVGAAGSGVQFYLDPPAVDGFVPPDYLSAVADGVVGGLDFSYEAATDSIWGYVKDETGEIIPFPTDVIATSDGPERVSTTTDGRYSLYFSDTDSRAWYLDFDSRVSPDFLAPEGLEIDLDTISGLHQDIVLTRTDTVVYARITEDGGLPSNSYLVGAYSPSLASFAEAVSGTGSDNVVAVHVSTLDPSDWYLYINDWDDRFPIPYGLVIQGAIGGVAPGDTVDLGLISGYLIGGSLTLDPGDAPIDWTDVYVSAGLYGANADGAGDYAFYASPGSYYVNVYADGYLADPQTRYVELTGDTSGGLGFVVNYAHARVTGTLTNVPLPLPGSYYTVTARTGTDEFDGYIMTAWVDSSTGTFQMDLCDGSWTLVPPCCFPDLEVPDSQVVVIGEIPDTARTVDFEYLTSGGTCCIPPSVGDVNQSGNIDIADISVMIDHQFLTLTPLVCDAEGDCDFSGDVDITDLSIMVDNQFLTLTPLPACP